MPLQRGNVLFKFISLKSIFCITSAIRLTLLLNVISLSLFSSTGYSTGKARVKFEDIKEWKHLSAVFAGGLDAKGKLLAIYDLTFPTLMDRMEIGFLDVSKDNYDNLTTL